MASVIQLIHSSKLLSHGLQGTESELAPKAATLATQVNEVISEIRRLARGLLPIELESNGLNAALESFTQNTSSTFDVNCQYRPDGEVLINDRIVSLHLFRIAQEAVNNAIRHGKASNIEVILKVRKHHFTLTIKDDGMGFDYENYQRKKDINGVGLQSMVYRAKLIKANVTFSRPDKNGFAVTVVRQS